MISSTPSADSGWPRRGPFNATNTRSVDSLWWSFVVQVVAERDEERVRDRHHPLMAALAFGDEQRPIRDAHIAQAQAEDLAAAQPTQHHRQDHRPVPMGAQRRQQRGHLCRARGSSAACAAPAPTAPSATGRLGVASTSPRGTGFDRHRRVATGDHDTRRSPTPTTTAGRSCAPTSPTRDRSCGSPCGRRADGRGTRTRPPPPPRPGPSPTTVKNVFRSNATARNVFGRDRPATNSR